MIISRKHRIPQHWKVVINAAVVFLCVVFVVRIGELLHGMRVSRERLEHVQNAHNQAVQQHQDLVQEYTDLTTPDGVEYYVRNHYRAISEGEELVVVVDPRAVVEPKPIAPLTWQERLRLFFHIP